MHAVMEALVQIQKLEFGSDAESPDVKAAIEKLRVQVPYQILGHYDRLRARGKKGLALVRNQVCAECHMAVPLGTVMTVIKGLDIQLCGNCGRYLYVLPETPPSASTPEPTAPAKARRTRRPKDKAEQKAAHP